MASSLQLCAPCRTAIRTGHIQDIKGPDALQGCHSVTFRWECALCITIAAARKLGLGRPTKVQWRILQETIRSLLHRPSDQQLHDRLLHLTNTASLAWSVPNPPISDLGDLVLVSSKIQRSDCRFRVEDFHSFRHSPRRFPTLRIVPKKRIDPLLVRKWLSHCEHNHERCTLRAPASGLSLLLIDVQRHCLVSTTAARYFALSYVWGNTDQFVLKAANLLELQKENALRRHWHQIAPVLKDAIAFVDSLSEQYLWVDTLCIVQDSPERQTYFSRMDEVYQGALCTLVATEGTDANSRLPGVDRNSRILNCLGENAGLEVARKRPDLASACINSTHEARAWTFQERTLSKRCLYFLNEQVHFRCQQAIWSEDRFEYCEQHFGTDDIHPSLQWIRNYSDRPFPEKFRAYARIVTQYSRKQLSFSSDRLDAFLGIISNLKEEWTWLFAAGLPTFCLDMALLWCSTTQSLHRAEFDGVQRYLPSWSWTGWLDGVNFRLTSSPARRPAFRTFGITAIEHVDIFQTSLDNRVYAPKRVPKRASRDPTPHSEGHEGINYVDPQLMEIPNLLMFWTEVVTGRSLPTTCTRLFPKDFYGEEVSHGYAYRIYGSNGPAGLLMYKGLALKKNCTYEFILIATEPYSSCFWKQECPSALDDGFLDAENDDWRIDNVLCNHYKRAPGRLLRIMLIKTVDKGYAERVAVGWVHEKAWLDARPVRKKICLG